MEHAKHVFLVAFSNTTARKDRLIEGQRQQLGNDAGVFLIWRVTFDL